MIRNTGTVGVALPLGVPCQAHWLGEVDLGPWKSPEGLLKNLITQGLALDTADLVAAEQVFIEAGINRTIVSWIWDNGTTNGTTRSR